MHGERTLCGNSLDPVPELSWWEPRCIELLLLEILTCITDAGIPLTMALLHQEGQ